MNFLVFILAWCGLLSTYEDVIWDAEKYVLFENEYYSNFYFICFFPYIFKCFVIE